MSQRIQGIDRLALTLQTPVRIGTFFRASDLSFRPNPSGAQSCNAACNIGAVNDAELLAPPRASTTADPGREFAAECATDEISTNRRRVLKSCSGMKFPRLIRNRTVRPVSVPTAVRYVAPADAREKTLYL